MASKYENLYHSRIALTNTRAISFDVTKFPDGNNIASISELWRTDEEIQDEEAWKYRKDKKIFLSYETTQEFFNMVDNIDRSKVLQLLESLPK